MSEKSYEDLVMAVKGYLDANPDAQMTLAESAKFLEKDMRRRGIPDTVATMFMVEFAAYIDRSKAR